MQIVHWVWKLHTQSESVDEAEEEVYYCIYRWSEPWKACKGGWDRIGLGREVHYSFATQLIVSSVEIKSCVLHAHNLKTN